MPGLRRAAFCAILLCPSPLLASSVFRCEDASGHVTFTQQGCPAKQVQYLQEIYNASPGRGKATPSAQPATSPRSRPTAESRELVVVGEAQDGCGNLVTGSERRTAMIRQQIRGGMHRRDVESSLGTPDKISSQNGQTRYHYLDRQGNKHQVSFDEAGCVKSKR